MLIRKLVFECWHLNFEMLKPGKNKVSFILSTTQVSYVQLAVTVSFTLEAKHKRLICVCVLCVHMCV